MGDVDLDGYTDIEDVTYLQRILSESEKAGTLTDAQAKQLFEAKLESETKELAAKRKYYPEFLKVLKPKKVWYAFDLANEKMSKIEGRDKD